MTDSINQALAAADGLFHAVHVGDWDVAAATVAAEDQTSFRVSQLASLLAWAQSRDAMREAMDAGGGMFGWSSDGTLDSEALVAFEHTPLRGLRGVTTLGELAALSPRAFLALYMEVSNPRWGAAEGGSMERPRRRAIGGVSDGAQVVHVLYRTEGPGIVYDDPHHVILARFRLVGETWFFDVNTSGQDVTDGSWFMTLVDEEFPYSTDTTDSILPDV